MSSPKTLSVALSGDFVQDAWGGYGRCSPCDMCEYISVSEPAKALIN